MKIPKVWWFSSKALSKALEEKLILANYTLENISMFNIDIVVDKRNIELADGIYFVSKAAVDGLFENLTYSTDIHKYKMIIATGQGTADYLKAKYNILPTVINPYKTVEEFFEHFNFKSNGISKLLIPLCKDSFHKYKKINIKYQPDLQIHLVEVYRRVPCEKIDQTLSDLISSICVNDVMVFTSPLHWQMLTNRISENSVRFIMKKTRIISIGPITSKSIKNKVGKYFIESNNPSQSSIVELIINKGEKYD
ncbi:uroporphyrinogen-III synthase [Ignavigranum ruoffiae]|uniref:Uroporphyrinogen-III synthase n=1 Tax=Ignavigranum ruoffiae TaxID=89093 RepID=A0A1H9CGP3_9LACT|nr:uroporphyrinogen-III synthase [Ignavigranum ruoffiae]SEQ00187.1 Uroporphyrinogen-III synthase [Ignavigranum ruoffiae]